MTVHADQRGERVAGRARMAELHASLGVFKRVGHASFDLGRENVSLVLQCVVGKEMLSIAIEG